MQQTPLLAFPATTHSFFLSNTRLVLFNYALASVGVAWDGGVEGGAAVTQPQAESPYKNKLILIASFPPPGTG